MNIAIFSFYSGINQRGVERWVYDIASRLQKTHNLTVFQNKALKTNTVYKIIATDLPYNEVNYSSNWLTRHLFIDYKSIKILLFVFRIITKLFKSNYDVVIPTDGGWESAIIRIITFIKRKKMIIIGHAGIGWDDANNLWCFPDIFVALSSNARKWAKKVNPFVKSVYIPDALDTQFFRPNGEKVSLSLKKPVVLCVSALEKGKRIDLIIKAVSKTNNLCLLVCGRGELEKDLQKMGNELLDKRFELMNFDFNEMPAVYRASDVFISASLPHYSFEMVLIEAMACGLPVIANNDPIRREIVGNAGVLLDVTNLDDLSKAIVEVIHKDWEDIPKKQADFFSWDTIIKSYLDLLSNLKNK